MALQGDLTSFALPDVLRLLAGTGKSGRLEISGIGCTGVLMLADGTLSSAKATSAPHASDIIDVVFELLRLEDGSFNFDEGEVSDRGIEADVDATISRAEALIAEWAEVEAVVPSMEAWITLAPEIDGDEIMVNADQWRALAIIAGGANVHDLAAALEMTDLAASRNVKHLVEAAMVEIRPSHGYLPPAVELDDFERFQPFGSDEDGFDVDALEIVASSRMTDIEDLVVEDRPVVMEERDDALLPEPLPSEGVAYEGESIVGIVDGRAVDPAEPMDLDDHDGESFAAFESLASFEQEAAMSALAGEPGTTDTFGTVDDFQAFVDGDEVAEVGSGEAVPALATAAAPEAEAASVVDDERGSLLKFLSTVKP